jgi:polar amino acid transport system substrate-binding protein
MDIGSISRTGQSMQVIIRSILVLCTVLASLNVTASENQARNFESIVASGELRIGVSIFPPWVMRAKDGHLVGSEIDMANRLAADMGLKPELALYEWKALITALKNKEIDIIISGMGINPSRAMQVNFSRPYGDAGVGLAANTALTSTFESMDELKKPNINIGVIANTVSADVANRLFSRTKITAFATEDEAQQALINGKVHALVAANPLPTFLALKHPGKVDVPLEKPLLSFKEGLAIRKGDADFLNYLDAWVVSRTADAWIPSTRQYWLETLEWKEQVQ